MRQRWVIRVWAKIFKFLYRRYATLPFNSKSTGNARVYKGERHTRTWQGCSGLCSGHKGCPGSARARVPTLQVPGSLLPLMHPSTEPMRGGRPGNSSKAAENYWAPLGKLKVSPYCGHREGRVSAAGDGVKRRMGPRRRAKAADKARRSEGEQGREQPRVAR